MANSFLTAPVVLRAALGLLQHQIVLPLLVDTNYSSQFTGGVGTTISLGRPASLTSAREYTDRASAIVLDELSEDKIDVTMGPLVYSAIAITDEDLTLDVVDFASQILQPQVRVVAEHVEGKVADLLEAVADDVVEDTSDALAAVAKAAVKLDQNNVPRQGRILAISPDLQIPFLNNNILRQVNTSGSPDALRDAEIGNLFGFRVVVTNGLTAGTAVAFVPEAFKLVTRAPAIPAGVSFAATESFAGISMRWTRDYDTAHMQDRSVLALLAGAKTVTEPDGKVHRAVKVVLSGS